VFLRDRDRSFFLASASAERPRSGAARGMVPQIDGQDRMVTVAWDWIRWPPPEGTMVAGRIPYLICKRGRWRAYGPDDSAVEADSLAELRTKLGIVVRARFGAGFAPVFLVGPRKPPRAKEPPDSSTPEPSAWREPEPVVLPDAEGRALLGR
jgi:hypothetical protein